MMTMKKFANNVEQHILEYLPEEFAGASVLLQEVVKDADKRLFGLSVKKKDVDYAPVLYLEGFYQKHYFEELSDMEDVMHEIAKAYLEISAITQDFDIPELTRDGVKSRLRLRLINTKRNKENLKNLVHKSLDSGLSMTVVIDIDKHRAARVTKDMAEMLSYDEAAMIKDAMENTAQNHPATLLDLHRVLFGLMGSGIRSEENLLNGGQTSDEIPGVMVLSTADQFEGSVAICYPGITKKISEVVEGSYYVLPSSIHEVLVMPDNGMIDPEQLKAMIRSVNTAEVAPHEQLGDAPLFYDSQTGLLKIAG